ncbi:YheT family hydrolase [Anaeromyxobacter diazotrophicus]|uniref:YheT family hydrolase n=1 Tax=Anaeromyxobacter diazotrophicus TaxID=2590199 RepID=UPI001F3E8D4F|nr:alpha/beta fold hydrolase [Anaeromyxobacter diazotrophicus]
MSYAPARWLPGPHLMTIFARLARGPAGLAPRRERWELDDGDFLDVDRHGEPGAPAVVILHGLEGSSRAPYVLRLVAACAARGLSSVAVNFRGCSGERNRLPRLYHSGETTDLDRVVARLVAERPGRPLGVAGFSLGGNVVAKWLGEGGERLPPEVRAGAVISVPFDLARCADAIDGSGGMARLYRARFLRTLRAKALDKTRRFEGLPFTAAEVRACDTFARFDDAVTSRLHGFAGARDYWTRCSSGRALPGLARPLLAIAAEDDPIVPRESLPLEVARHTPALRLETYPAGGHVGFVSGRPWRFEFFAEARAATFLDEALRR